LAATTVKVLGVLSTSVSVSVPVAVGVSCLAQPASNTGASRGAGNDGRVVGAVDGDPYHLWSAIGGHLEGVGQRVADIERLHHAVRVVSV
jgi:hypothetical protein